VLYYNLREVLTVTQTNTPHLFSTQDNGPATLAVKTRSHRHNYLVDLSLGLFNPLAPELDI